MLKYGIEHFYIELLEEFPCENSNQLEKREGELTRELKASLNKTIAGRTMEEYKAEKAEKLKKQKQLETRNTEKNIEKN